MGERERGAPKLGSSAPNLSNGAIMRQ